MRLKKKLLKICLGRIIYVMGIAKIVEEEQDQLKIMREQLVSSNWIPALTCWNKTLWLYGPNWWCPSLDELMATVWKKPKFKKINNDNQSGSLWYCWSKNLSAQLNLDNECVLFKAY